MDGSDVMRATKLAFSSAPTIHPTDALNGRLRMARSVARKDRFVVKTHAVSDASAQMLAAGSARMDPVPLLLLQRGVHTKSGPRHATQSAVEEYSAAPHGTQTAHDSGVCQALGAACDSVKHSQNPDTVHHVIPPNLEPPPWPHGHQDPTHVQSTSPHAHAVPQSQHRNETSARFECGPTPAAPMGPAGPYAENEWYARTDTPQESPTHRRRVTHGSEVALAF